MGCSRLGRRELRKQETKRALVDAALELVVRHGLDQVTIEMITDAAGVSPRTFFNYFPSKEDALVSVDEFQGLVQAIEVRPAGEEPLEVLRAAMQEVSALLADCAAQWLMRKQVILAHPVLHARMVGTFEPLERNLIEAIARRCGQDAARDLYPSMVCAAAMGAGKVAIRRWFEGGCTGPMASHIDEAFDLLAQGLKPPSSSVPAQPEQST
jgi:AcrR family transcriptional regulator